MGFGTAYNRELSKTYSPIVGGKIINMNFNSLTSEFNLEYISNGNRTYIYLNRDFYLTIRVLDGLSILEIVIFDNGFS